MRRFVPLFGATTPAVAATLCGFFLGLAVGSLVLGRRSGRWTRPLRAFGLLEIGVGLGAALVEPILGLYRGMYPFLHERLSAFPAVFVLAKLVLAAAALGLPTFCMGATLPALGEAVAPTGRRLGIPVGGLYAINLLGAAVGTLAVPFLLLPRLGLALAYGGAIAGSLAVGTAAVVVDSRSPAVAPRGEGARRRDGAAAPSGVVLVLALSAVSGLCTLALQTLWARMFALVHENSVHSFAVVLFVFLTGLFGGAALSRRHLAQGRPPRSLLAAGWCAAGILVVASPRIFHAMTGGLGYVSAVGWHAMLGRLLLIGTVTMLPACVGLGMALPLVMEMAGGEERPGPVIGRQLAANTVGAMAGPLLATFVLGPALGLWWSVVGLGGLLVAAGAWAGLPRPQAALAGGLLAGALLLRPADLPPVRVDASAGQRLVSVREGTHGTTAVLANARDRWITVNNSYVLGGTAAAEEERWQAHLPLLLHPSPRWVAFVGMGTGITAGAALVHPVQRVVALEIVPEVAAAARADFADANARALEDPRLMVAIDDGRNHLAVSEAAFDVIVGDLLVPWRPAEAPLYTREHFESVRRALAADGVFCQWLPLYQLSPDQLASIIATFVDVFPRSTLWRGNFIADEATLALVGHTNPRPLDFAGVDSRVIALSEAGDSNPFLAHPAGAWLYLVGPVDPRSPWLARASLNTDAEPRVELLSPAALAEGTLARPTEVSVAAFLDEAARQPVEGTVLQGLREPHRAWAAAGAALSKASAVRGLQGAEGVRAILRTLPPELQRSLEVDD